MYRDPVRMRHRSRDYICKRTFSYARMSLSCVDAQKLFDQWTETAGFYKIIDSNIEIRTLFASPGSLGWWLAADLAAGSALYIPFSIGQPPQVLVCSVDHQGEARVVLSGWASAFRERREKDLVYVLAIKGGSERDVYWQIG